MNLLVAVDIGRNNYFVTIANPIGLLIAWAIGDHFRTTARFPALVVLHPLGGHTLIN